jgi:hypothetical protein
MRLEATRTVIARCFGEDRVTVRAFDILDEGTVAAAVASIEFTRVMTAEWAGEHRKSPICLLLVPVQPAPAPAAEAARSHHATAVPSSSTIKVGIASRVTPSIVVVGATPTAPNRVASTP